MELKGILKKLNNQETFNYFTKLLKAKLSGSIIIDPPHTSIIEDLESFLEIRTTFDCPNCGRPIHTSQKNEYYNCECDYNIKISEIDTEKLYLLNRDIYNVILTIFQAPYNYNGYNFKIILGRSVPPKLSNDGLIFILINPSEILPNELKILDNLNYNAFLISWAKFLDLFVENRRERIFNKILFIRNQNLIKEDKIDFNPEKTINFIHLSDFHFKGDDSDNEKGIIVERIIKDLTKKLIPNDKIDFIIISGDIANSGKFDQYTKAKELLIEVIEDPVSGLGVEREKIFVVPGNHDVDRNLFDEDLFRDLTKKYDEKELSNFWYQDQFSERFLNNLKKFDAFKQFQNDILNQNSMDDKKLYIIREFEKLNFSIGILGLNTVWLSGFDDERGHLLMCKFQIIDCFFKDYNFENYDLNIVFYHHPIEGLNEAERDEIKPLIYDNFQLIFFGHRHSTNYYYYGDYQTETHVIRAGTIHSLNEKIRGTYNLIQLHTEKKIGRIIFRKPSRSNPAIYVDDWEAGGEIENHLNKKGRFYFNF